MNRYRHLMAPGKIKDLTIANRMVMPPMETSLASYDGEVTPELLAYYEARARSGPGIIVVEIACVDAPRGKAALNQLRIDHPRYLPGLSRLAEVIKSGGSRAFIQLHHAGRQTSLIATEGQAPLAPSAIPCRLMRVMPEEASLEDIHQVQLKFVTSAVLASMAGFDGVELHAAHGYLLSQFLSPYTNKREDDYGGSTERRARIVCEILQMIKQQCPSLAVGVRLNLEDFVAGGLELEEGLKIAELLEDAGADYLSVSCGIYESGERSIETVSFPEGWRLYLGKAAKERVKIPVIAGGVIRHPDAAEKALADGMADFIWVGRNQIADPEWAAKVRKGRPKDIRPCLSCNTCIGRSLHALPVACAVNPLAGRESWLKPLLPAENPARVLVVGGGPAGIWAAVRLSQRGHRVTLVEKNDKLGGMLNAAAVPPNKQRIAEFLDYLIRELGKTRVEVRLGQELTRELVEAIVPQAVLVATGARPLNLPDLTGENVLQAVDVLNGKEVKGKNIVVLGGGITGCETALYLAQKGFNVVLVEASSQLAAGMENMNRMELLSGLKKSGVKRLLRCSLKGLQEGQALLQMADGSTENVFCDALILALGMVPVNESADWLRELVPQIRVIGDADRPRNIETALYQAEVAARTLV